MIRKGIIVIIAVCLISSFGNSNVYSQVVVKVKPVRTKTVIVKSNKPGGNYVWIEGQWKWNKKRQSYVWVDGRWAKRPRNSSVWVAGKWKKVAGGYKYIPGHWA